MVRLCFVKKDTNPPICCVHNVPLVQRHSSDNLPTSGFGSFTFFVCPVSGEVVRDTATHS